jgi:hypothetical protein
MEGKRKAYHLVLVYSYGAGFFSLFNKLFGYLEKYSPIAAVSFQVYNPFKAYGEGEIFSKVFIPYVNQEYINDDIEVVECFHYTDEKLTGRIASRLYTEKGCLENNISLHWRQQMNVLWRTYYQVHNQSIIRKFQTFVEQLKTYRVQGKRIVTFLLRHPALNVEQENNILPSYAMYDTEIQNQCKGDLSKVVLVCLTDSQEAYEYFSEKYKNFKIIFPEVERRRANETDSTYNAGGDEKIEMAMLSVLYLSVGDHFIHPVSNMATAVLIINPAITHTYLVGF